MASIAIFADTFWSPKSGADIASYLGIFLAIIGFVVTVIQVRKARSAADAAAEAAINARKDLQRMNSIQGIATAATLIGELKQMLAIREYPGTIWILPSKCERLKEILLENKERIEEEDDRVLTPLLVTLTNLEMSLTRARFSETPFDSISFYGSLGGHLDELLTILSRLKEKS